jgi:hypothetical protein
MTGDFYRQSVQSRDRLASMEMGYGLEGRGIGVRFPAGERDFLIPKAPRPGSGSTQLPMQGVQGAVSPEVKWPGREGDHSHLSSAKNKNTWIYTSTSPHVFMA